nr:hypothetical protein [Anaerolineae bacterium]
MQQRTTRFAVGCAVAIGAALVSFILFTSMVGIYTDWLWFASLDQLSTYQAQLWARAGLWLAGALVVILVLVVNWFIVPRWLFGPLQLPQRDPTHPPLAAYARSLAIIQRLAVALVAVVMASGASARWLSFLTFRHAAPFGLSDPIFGRDASFYVFRLPLYRYLVGWLLGLIGVTLLGCVLAYLSTQRIRKRAATTHLSALGVLFLLGKAVDYQLQRFALLDSSRGAVFGAGYTDVHARMPLLHLLT